MANIKIGNTAIGKVSVIEPYEDEHDAKPIPVPRWRKPSEWLGVPANPSNATVFYASVAVWDTDQELVRINFDWGSNAGSVDVNWGDGTSETVTAPNQYGVSASHKYNFSDISSDSEIELDGKTARQALITVTPSAGSNDLTQINLSAQAEADYYNRSTAYALLKTRWLELYLNWSTVTDFIISGRSQRSTQADQLRVVKIASNSLYRIVCPAARKLRQFIYQDAGLLTSLYYAWQGCTELESVPNIDTSNVTDFQYSLHSTAIRQGPNWDTSSSTTFKGMFATCRFLEKVPEYDYSSVTDLSSMFSGCLNLKSLKVGNAPNVTNASSMFSRCASLASIAFTGGGVSTATNLSSIFYYCHKLSVLQNFRTNSATNLSNAFYACYILLKISINTDNVTTLQSAFRSCVSVRKIVLTSVANLTTIREAFSSCYQLESLRIRNLNSSNLSGSALYSSFANCLKLRRLPSFSDTSACTSYYNCCANMQNLEKFPDWDLSGMTDGRGFLSCTNYPNVRLTQIPDITVTGITNNNNFGFTNLYALSGVGNIDCRNATRNHNFYGVNNVQQWGTMNLSSMSSSYYFFYGSSSTTMPKIIFSSGCSVGTWNLYSVREVPDIDLSGVTIGNTFVSMHHLDSFKGYNITENITFNGSAIPSGTINHIQVSGLASGVTNRTLTLTNVSRASEVDFTVALSKGWTVTT